MDYLNEPIAGLDSLAPVLIPLMLMFLIFLLIVLILVIALRNRSDGPSDKHYLYQPKPNFLTRNELVFYASLLPLAASKQYTVFTKVRISDLLEPRKECSNRQASIGRINTKCVDFLLCDQSTLTPVLVIQLQDPAHKNAEHFDRDSPVDKAFQSAELPVLFVRSAENLEALLDSVLAGDGSQNHQPA